MDTLKPTSKPKLRSKAVAALAADPPPVIGRTSSGGFKTQEGTLYVSKPFRSQRSKKLRAMVAFMPRKSAFDTTNEMSGANEFRGFFTLFWISMFLFTVRTYIRSIEEHGHFLPLVFARSISQDAITLALSDAALVLTTGLCVPFAMLIRDGWIRYKYTGMILQHIFQAAVLGIVVTWTFNRQWPWVQSGFLTLHALVMIMKMHSYMATNGYLSQVALQIKRIKKQMHQLAEQMPGGWDAALAMSQARRAELDALTDASDTETTASAISPSPSMSNGRLNVPHAGFNARTSVPTTPSLEAPTDGTSRSYIDANSAATLRQRLVSAAEEPTFARQEDRYRSKKDDDASIDPTPPLPNGNMPGMQGINFTRDPTELERGAPGVHPLVDHPDDLLSALARELSELEGELVSSGPQYVHWPANISAQNFAVYQLIPTLVYELEYPRTDRIRPLYIFEKTVATFGSFALLYTITESFIIPLTPTPDQSFFRSLLDLALPFMVSYLLLFYLIFECICNGFAELSYFADRQFYEDWWNSTSWDEFSRKWNKPVHAFLLRHVYASTISTYHLSRTSAMFVTFLLSASVHELVMAIVTQKIRMYLFSLQLIQIPLIALGRVPVIKRNKLAGNIVFWLGLYAGFPLLCVAYCAY